MQKPTKQDLVLMANKLLSKNGYAVDGTFRKYFSKDQRFVEKRVIGTPMGNRSR